MTDPVERSPLRPRCPVDVLLDPPAALIQRLGTRREGGASAIAGL